ncbi:alpha/beta hydrolase [Tenacibaculum sp. SDUM215027]|uniref:alpha/beta hydrolase n=1 Tax=Tenacibaculum sp. SDUM215027 TaxID=3422596 RepID=UPI003D312C45
MKYRLIILSDLWGVIDASWVSMYVDKLSEDFEVTFYSSCELAEIPEKNLSEEERHHFFVNGGIEKAVKKLVELEKERLIVLAFSIGGTIGWKACLKGLNVKKLYAISSTRLRYETEKPKAEAILYFGEEDNYKPNNSWFERMEVDYSIIPQKAHEVYKEEEFAAKLCLQIKNSYEPS